MLLPEQTAELDRTELSVEADSPSHVASIYYYILARHVCGCITRHKNSDAFKIVRIAPLAHRNTACYEIEVGFILWLCSSIFVDVGRDISVLFSDLQKRATKHSDYPGETQFTRMP